MSGFPAEALRFLGGCDISFFVDGGVFGGPNESTSFC